MKNLNIKENSFVQFHQKIGFKFEKNVEDSVKDIIHNEGN